MEELRLPRELPASLYAVLFGEEKEEARYRQHAGGAASVVLRVRQDDESRGQERMRLSVSVAVKEALKETGEALPSYPHASQPSPTAISRLFARRVLVEFGRVLYTSRPTSTSTLVRSSGFQVGTPMVSRTPR